jgi:hypothetical protein
MLAALHSTRLTPSHRRRRCPKIEDQRREFKWRGAKDGGHWKRFQIALARFIHGEPSSAG